MIKQDISNDTLHAATEWFVKLTSGEETEKDKKAWQEWVDALPENKQAWQRVEDVTRQFRELDSQTSIAVLNRKSLGLPSSNDRRQALKSLGMLFVVGSVSLLAYKNKPWYELLADYSTETGEIKHVTLEDGSRLVLNTNSKISINFNDQTRNIRLLQGEVYVETAHETSPHYRPFNLTTEHGTVTALGTKFSTQIHKKRSYVNVYQDAVEVRTLEGAGDKITVNADERVAFTSELFQQKLTIDSSSMAWTRGFIIADKMPLAKFVSELSRYNVGVLRCDSAIADLEISGAFPVNDIDGVLNSVSTTLSIRVEKITRYWRSIKPA